MRTIGEQIEQSGGTLVLIGNGTVDDARRYALEEDLPFELLVDPQLVGYGALELRRSVLATYSPRAIPRFVRALREGFRASRAYGVTDQMGGVFVISPSGEVSFGHESRSLGDEPPPELVIEALQRAAGELDQSDVGAG